MGSTFGEPPAPPNPFPAPRAVLCLGFWGALGTPIPRDWGPSPATAGVRPWPRLGPRTKRGNARLRQERRVFCSCNPNRGVPEELQLQNRSVVDVPPGEKHPHPPAAAGAGSKQNKNPFLAAGLSSALWVWWEAAQILGEKERKGVILGQPEVLAGLQARPGQLSPCFARTGEMW